MYHHKFTSGNRFLVPVVKHDAMKAYGGVEIKLHTFFTVALDGDQIITFMLWPFHFQYLCCIGGWVGPGASLDTVAQRKISLTFGFSQQ
jgi:hypothetical protein